MFDGEGNRYKEEIDNLQHKLKESDASINDKVVQYEQKFKNLDNQI